MRRREFVKIVAALVAARPLTAHAQRPAMPVIGYLNAATPERYVDQLRAFRQGLKENGYVEGEIVAIEYHWGENEPDRLNALAADLVRRRVDVIAAASAPASLAAAKATTEIPTAKYALTTASSSRPAKAQRRS